MRIDVADLFGLHPCVFQSFLHDADSTGSAGVRHRDVKSVTAHAIAHDLCINASVTFLLKVFSVPVGILPASISRIERWAKSAASAA